MHTFPGLSWSCDSPVTLIFMPIANLSLFGWIVVLTGKFAHNNKGLSTIFNHKRCYSIQSLITALLLSHSSLLYPLLIYEYEYIWNGGPMRQLGTRGQVKVNIPWKLLDSDWLREMHFECNTSAKSVSWMQIRHCNSGL